MAGGDRLISQTAARLGKEVATLRILGGDDLWVDPQVWRPFLRSLTHVFRNAVVHGIEDPDTRLAQGKSEAGCIECGLQLDAQQLQLSISDDGAGIDLPALRQRAVSAGLLTATQAAGLSAQQTLELIFLDNVSTQQQVTELAGRGVGLAAVRHEARQLKGEVTVHSLTGQGTRLVFTLPR
ncbi:gliding motility regulatory protein [mine drainage metagenome]|uniref:histidine kinase n=1 Tax=mine drainage metagenome TaxID=410659 RepID=A0A1J5PXL8_9ZZZZ